MIQYIIALHELGLKNNDLLFLLQNYSSEIERMFSDNLIFDNRIELITYQGYFGDKDLVIKALSKANMILERNKVLNIKTTLYTLKN